MLGGGLDDDGGLLTIEEIDDVDVEYVETEAGGRIARLKKRDQSSSKKRANNSIVGHDSSKPALAPPTTNVEFDQSLLPEWSSIPLHPVILHSLLALSFTKPTPIQKAALPIAQAGRDIVGVAETGSGKTLAYSLPILQHILSKPATNKTLAALILAPTRELALQDFYLYYFLLRYPGRSLVFVSSIDGIRRLTPIMELLQLKAFPLHSQLQQRQRLKNLDRFKSTPSAVLIATDVAARGLDIPSVDHVIHYQLPRTADAYVHRNGRTARAQREGFSLLLIAPNERGIMKGLMDSLKRTEPIAELPIEHDILDRLKQRVQLARQIDVAQ
ncbi:unnamed protein product, partial [Rhizoctonia solani]